MNLLVCLSAGQTLRSFTKDLRAKIGYVLLRPCQISLHLYFATPCLSKCLFRGYFFLCLYQPIGLQNISRFVSSRILAMWYSSHENRCFSEGPFILTIFIKETIHKEGGGMFPPHNLTPFLMIDANYIGIISSMPVIYCSRKSLSHLQWQSVVTFRISVYIKASFLASDTCCNCSAVILSFLEWKPPISIVVNFKTRLSQFL